MSRHFVRNLQSHWLEDWRIMHRKLSPNNFLAIASITFLAMLTLPSVSWCQKTAGKFELKATAFQPGGNIPKQYTCEGADVSPALVWTAPPAGTRSFALIMDDPDAPSGTFVHWVVYDLPASARHLPEHIPANDEIQGGGKQGRNGFPLTGYGGPCPPKGKPHHYFFKLYALDTRLDLGPGARKEDVEKAMQGHVLAEAELVGLYAR
jgi:Raf kinase inhibitor-like YbhB/YbcL family protein